MNPGLRLGLGLLIIGWVGIASGCSNATQEIPRTARLEFSRNGVPYQAALHEFYAWRSVAHTLLAPHELIVVDTGDASYVATIDVKSLPNASTPFLSVVSIGLNAKRPRQSAAAYIDKDKDYSPRFNRPMHESFKLVETLERAAQTSPTSSH